MRNGSKLFLAALATTIVFGTLVATASARRYALSNQSFRVTWRSLEFDAGLGIFLKCPVTIEGSFHSRTLSKVLEQLIGHVTRAIVKSEQCTNGSAWILTTNLPWHIRYDGFSGTLPDIVEIHLRLILAEFLIQTVFPVLKCLYRSTVASPMRGWISFDVNDRAIFLEPDHASPIPLAAQLPGSGTCPASGRLNENEGEIYLQGSSTVRITVTLVA